MAGWNKFSDGSSSRNEGELYGSTWYVNGAFLWRVTWTGWHVKEGTGCVDGAEARREADLIIDACLRGDIKPPWKNSDVYEDLKSKLEAARARDGVKKSWGNYP